MSVFDRRDPWARDADPRRPARYALPPETMPGARPGLAVNPWMLMIGFWAAPWTPVLCAWAVFNAWVLGCFDLRRQAVTIAVACGAVAVLDATRVMLDEAEFTVASDMAVNVMILTAVFTMMYALRRQMVMAAHLKPEGNTRLWRGIAVVGVLYVVDLFAPAVERTPVLLSLWGMGR